MRPTSSGGGQPIDQEPQDAVTFTNSRGVSLTLRSPVMTAAGCFGDGTRFARATWLGRLGAIVTQTVTASSRRKRLKPEIIETAAGLLYVPHLSNPGLYRTLRDAAPVWAGLAAPIIVSITAETDSELCSMAIELESVSGVIALELNMAGPDVTDVDGSRDAGNIVGLVEMLTAATSLPLLVKLSPASDVVTRAQAAEEGGAVAVTIAHGWPGAYYGLDVEPAFRQPHQGLLAGPAILPLTLRIVTEVSEAIGVGVIGCGGIANPDAALQHFAAGARAVQVGSALFRDPSLAASIAVELSVLPRDAGGALTGLPAADSLNEV